MRIGIDAKSFFSGPVSTTVILQNLLPKLFSLYPQVQWIIFLDRKDKDKLFPFRQPNILIEYVWADINLISNLFFLQPGIRNHKIDIMLYQTFPRSTADVKSVAFVHDVLFKEYPHFFTLPEKLYFLPLKWLLPKADRIITTTRFVANDLVKWNYSTLDKIDLAPLGVSPVFKPAQLHDAKFLQQVKQKFHLPDEYLFFAGRLNKRKNIEAIFNSLPLINNKNIQLVIAGSKHGRNAHFKMLKSAAFSKRILFTGNVTNEELSALYALSKIFCFPSHAEGFGLPPLEAMASGVPAITSNTTALPEVFGEAAIYVSPGHPAEIAAAINHLLGDKLYYELKKHQALQKASEYNWEKTAENVMHSLLKLYLSHQPIAT
ncbi:MAG: hypothetical protein C4308_10100 [Chitinophagaceae bacterium]